MVNYVDKEIQLTLFKSEMLILRQLLSNVIKTTMGDDNFYFCSPQCQLFDKFQELLNTEELWK